jgi:seryl-tRNA synthetase
MYSASPMLDLGYVREHLDVIEKMGRDRGIALDLEPFRAIDAERRALITSAERLKAEEEGRRRCVGDFGIDEGSLRQDQAR